MRLNRLPALSLLILLVLSACLPASPVATNALQTPAVSAGSSPTPTQTSTPAPTSSPTPLPTLGVDPSSLRGLTIQAWHAFGGPASDLFTSQAAEFSTGNKWGITVNPVAYGDYTSLFDGVTSGVDSGQSPDLVAALPEQTLAWNPTGAVVDLNPYLDDPQWALDDRADFPSIFWAQDHVDGKQLGVPAQRSARFIFYNTTWAHELGFDNPPASPEDFRQQACAANASYRRDTDPTNDGYGGWIMDTDWQTTYSWLLGFGGGVADGSSYTFRTDPNLAALQFGKTLFDSHCAWLSIEPTPFDSFARRSALFISADLAELPAEMESMARLKNSDQWTVMPFPGSQASVVVTYGPSYSVLKSSPAKQLAAWLFARWLLSPESQSRWVETTGLFPLRNSELGMIQPYRQASPQWDAAIGYLSLAQSVPQLASWRKVRYVLEDGLTVLYQNALTADKLPAVLEQMDAMAQELK